MLEILRVGCTSFGYEFSSFKSMFGLLFELFLTSVNEANIALLLCQMSLLNSGK